MPQQCLLTSYSYFDVYVVGERLMSPAGALLEVLRRGPHTKVPEVEAHFATPAHKRGA